MRVLSLGWGVQSFTLAAMSALGELEPLDAAIHADTGYERQATYEFAAKWTPWLVERGVQVLTVHRQHDRGVVYRNPRGSFTVNIPAFGLTSKGDDAQIARQCTGEWKVRPQKAALRVLMAEREVRHVEQWLGISGDEWRRARDSDVGYITSRFPLLEMTPVMDRKDCVKWLHDHDLQVPSKSSCTFCPYQSQKSWQRLKRNGGPDWEQALEVDTDIRRLRPNLVAFVHPARIPLADAVDIPEDHGYVQTGFDPEGKCDEAMCWV